MDMQDLYQELIIDHGTKPRNHQAMPDASHSANGFNPLCGDKIKVFLKLNHDLIEDISFVGSGCAISQASASIMTGIVKAQTRIELRATWEQFQSLLTHQSDGQDKLGKLKALAGVKAYPSRIKCATLAWHTLLSALDSPCLNGATNGQK